MCRLEEWPLKCPHLNSKTHECHVIWQEEIRATDGIEVVNQLILRGGDFMYNVGGFNATQGSYNRKSETEESESEIDSKDLIIHWWLWGQKGHTGQGMWTGSRNWDNKKEIPLENLLKEHHLTCSLTLAMRPISNFWSSKL